MAKTQLIPAISREILYGTSLMRAGRAGFLPITDEHLKLLESETFQRFLSWKPREYLENDFRYVHFIPYIVITDKAGKVLTYQRQQGIGEDRLLGKVSIGIGGHMDVTPEQSTRLFSGSGSMDALFMRSVRDTAYTELFEEVEPFGGCPMTIADCDMQLIGIVFDDRGETTEVGRVHLGLVYQLQVADVEQLDLKEEELVRLEPLSITTYRAEDHRSYAAMETWSSLVYDAFLLSAGEEHVPTVALSTDKELPFVMKLKAPLVIDPPIAIASTAQGHAELQRQHLDGSCGEANIVDAFFPPVSTKPE